MNKIFKNPRFFFKEVFEKFCYEIYDIYKKEISEHEVTKNYLKNPEFFGYEVLETISNKIRNIKEMIVVQNPLKNIYFLKNPQVLFNKNNFTKSTIFGHELLEKSSYTKFR